MKLFRRFMWVLEDAYAALFGRPMPFPTLRGRLYHTRIDVFFKEVYWPEHCEWWWKCYPNPFRWFEEKK